jgi:hypothetical protein
MMSTRTRIVNHGRNLLSATRYPAGCVMPAEPVSADVLTRVRTERRHRAGDGQRR